ncbi:MAG: exo-alpha-sialidase [uncultured Clostridium sp.]
MKTEPIDLFKPGDLGSQNFRIPALFTTKDGTVIASIDVRNKGGADAPWNDIDSAIRRKTLGGEWEEAQKVIDYPNGASVIDTSLTQDEETGRVFLLVTTFPENYGFWQAEAGSGYTEIDGVKYRSLYDASENLYTIRESGNVYDSEGNITNYNVNVNTMELTKDNNVVGNVMTASCELKVYGTSYLSLIYSDDDGATWSKPVDINSDIKADWMKFLGTGPGSGIQIKNGEYAGRIVFPVYYTNGAGKQSSAVIYSDDHGETWNMGESPNDGRDLGDGSFGNSQTMTGGLELTECQAVEMPNGQLKLFMRNTGSYVRIATSFDGGATWDSEVYEDTNLPEPYCQLSVMNYSKKIDGQDAIVFANPKGTGRTNGTVRFGIIKQNGTHSNGEPRYEFEWKYNKLVKAGTYAYSCLTELPNGDIGLFYEGTDNKEMSYIKMSPEYIKFDYESSLEELVDPGKIESIELLDGKNSYTPGDKITVKLSFDQAVSLIGNKNLILKIGDSKIILNPISEGNAREFKFEGTLPTTLSEGTFNLVLECNNDIEILNTVGKNTTLNGDIELGNSITINKVIDKSDLVKVIENAKNIIENETDKYTESSIDALKEAIAIAEETIANEVATQEQVDSSYNVLLRAYLSLRLTPDKSLLEGLIKEVSSIDLSKYTAKSAEIVEKALEDANKVLNNEEATEKEVNTALENLKNAKNSLVASSDSNSNTNSNQNSNSDSNANSNSGNSSTNNNKDSSNSSTGNSTTGKLPQTGTTGVAGTLISGIVTLLCGLGLSRKKNN